MQNVRSLNCLANYSWRPRYEIRNLCRVLVLIKFIENFLRHLFRIPSWHCKARLSFINNFLQRKVWRTKWAFCNGKIFKPWKNIWILNFLFILFNFLLLKFLWLHTFIERVFISSKTLIEYKLPKRRGNFPIVSLTMWSLFPIGSIQFSFEIIGKMVGGGNSLENVSVCVLCKVSERKFSLNLINLNRLKIISHACMLQLSLIKFIFYWGLRNFSQKIFWGVQKWRQVNFFTCLVFVLFFKRQNRIATEFLWSLLKPK